MSACGITGAASVAPTTTPAATNSRRVNSEPAGSIGSGIAFPFHTALCGGLYGFHQPAAITGKSRSSPQQHDDVVRRVTTRADAQPARNIQQRQITAGNCQECKLSRIERIAADWLHVAGGE